MPGRAPRRYKMDENGTVRSAFHGKLPEEFTERDMLAFAADTDLLLFQKVSEETLAAIRAAGYDYQGRASSPGPERRKQTWQNRKQRFRRRNGLPSGVSWRLGQRRLLWPMCRCPTTTFQGFGPLAGENVFTLETIAFISSSSVFCFSVSFTGESEGADFSGCFCISSALAGVSDSCTGISVCFSCAAFTAFTISARLCFPDSFAVSVSGEGGTFAFSSANTDYLLFLA